MCARIVDHYELHEELGRGGMATVYRATDLRLQREVALKLLHAHIADQPDSRDRFIREARAAARLRHKNILHIYDFSGDEGDVGYLATELIDGPTLREMDARDLRAYPEIAACLLWILARALGEAHAAGVIHRDIKPENIMVDASGQPRLMDFGLARVRDTQRMTMTGTLLGSPAHMAPEIIDGKDYDGRVDIFALGTVLYFLCTGHLPFDADTPASLLRKILVGEYTSARIHNERILTPLDRIIDRMLANDPNDRFESSQALTEALGDFLARIDIEDPERVFQEWWTQSEAFFSCWKPQLIAAVQKEAEDAVGRGHSALTDALDWTNRLLTLDPQNTAGHDLLIRISTQSNRAQLLQRVGITVLTILAIALPMLLVRLWITHAPPATYASHTFIHTTMHELMDRAAQEQSLALARARARDVVQRTEALHEPPHVHATQRAQNAVHEQQESARRQSEHAAQLAARRARRKSNAENTGGSASSAAPSPSKAKDKEPAQAPESFQVRVLVQPPIAEIFVDGEKRCNNATRCQLHLPAGSYEFVARHPVTDMQARRTVQIEHDGMDVRMRVPWKPATLIVECDRPGIVLLDGQRIGRTGDSIRVNIEGIHSTRRSVVRVIPDGDFGVPIERAIELSSGETRRERVQF